MDVNSSDINTNSTLSEFPRSLAIAGAAIASVIIIVGVFGNGLLLMSLVVLPSLRLRCNLFVATMTGNYLFSLLVVSTMGAHGLLRRTWPFSGFACRLYNSFSQSVLGFSVFHIFLITSYRYMMVVKPNWYVWVSKTWVMTFILIIVLLLSYIGPMVPALSKGSDIEVVFNTKYLWCEFEQESIGGESTLIVIWYLAFLLIMCFLYLRIYLVVKKSAARVNATANDMNHKKKSTKEAQIAKTMIVLMVIFAVTYFPWPLAYDQEKISDTTLPDAAALTLSLLQWSAASVNWIVYGLMNSQFRNAYHKLLTSRWNKMDARDSSKTAQISTLN